MANRTVVPFPKVGRNAPSVGSLLGRVRGLASDSLKIRMIERGIDMRSVLEVVRGGRAVGRPELDGYGDWTIGMRRKVAGRRVHVAVAVCAARVERIATW